MKALSASAKDLLVEIIIENTVALALNKLTEIGELVQHGYIKSGPAGVSATTKGVKRAIALKLVKQDGVEFVTPEGKRGKRAVSKPALVVANPVHKPAHSNAWVIGFEDAQAGLEPSGPFAADPEYLQGHKAFAGAKLLVGDKPA